jgi:K+-sensing histidine kinase KdpD
MSVGARIDDCVARLGVNDVTCSIEPGLVLRQDGTYVDLIISNLFENADRYRESRSTIHCSAHSVQLNGRRGIVLLVRNRRTGHAVIDSERVFEKYWREPHSRSHRGAGLGLWLARHAARTLGGDLTCQLVGADIEFRLALPSL